MTARVSPSATGLSDSCSESYAQDVTNAARRTAGITASEQGRGATELQAACDVAAPNPVDYSRFYLVGGRLTGYQLYCLDCDEDDLVPFDESDDDPLDLGQMVRAADRHVESKHAQRPAEEAVS